MADTVDIKELQELTNPEAPVSERVFQPFYPLTHEKAVRDSDGNTLESKLAQLQENMQQEVNKLIEDYKPIVVEGDVTNVPDEEDLTSYDNGSQNVIRLKDKEYNSLVYSGLGIVYLRKNIVNGENILTQAMMNKANTIYVIQYDYNLNGATINIQAGCVLKFEGGSLSNGTIAINGARVFPDYNVLLKNGITVTGMPYAGTFYWQTNKPTWSDGNSWVDANGSLVDKVPTPVIKLVGENSITITCDMYGGIEHATIYYTTDGSTPTTSSSQYTSPLTVANGTTIKAIGVESNKAISDVASYTYRQRCAQPYIYQSSNVLNMSSSTSNATIDYTVDGSEPGGATSIRYTGPIDLTTLYSGMLIRAVAYAVGYTSSLITSYVVH